LFNQSGRRLRSRAAGDTAAEDDSERETLLKRVCIYQQAAAEQVEKLRVQLARAEDFAATLDARLEQSSPAARF
jgi:hypothetical protein